MGDGGPDFHKLQKNNVEGNAYLKLQTPVYVPFTKSPCLTSIQEYGDSYRFIKFDFGILPFFFFQVSMNRSTDASKFD